MCSGRSLSSDLQIGPPTTNHKPSGTCHPEYESLFSIFSCIRWERVISAIKIDELPPVTPKALRSLRAVMVVHHRELPSPNGTSSLTGGVWIFMCLCFMWRADFSAVFGQFRTNISTGFEHSLYLFFFYDLVRCAAQRHTKKKTKQKQKRHPFIPMLKEELLPRA